MDNTIDAAEKSVIKFLCRCMVEMNRDQFLKTLEMHMDEKSLQQRSSDYRKFLSGLYSVGKRITSPKCCEERCAELKELGNAIIDNSTGIKQLVGDGIVWAASTWNKPKD